MCPRSALLPIVIAVLVLAESPFARGEDASPVGKAPEPAAPAAARVPAQTETILVVGSPEKPTEGIPGAVEVIGKEELDRQQPISVAEALRGTTGVNLRSEDAFLLPNIGVRGLNPDRSEKMLVLEDGLPASLAPYNENAAYYMPPVERMERLELLKGSGSILYGPQTVGGVLNLVTRRPSAEPAGSLTAAVGEDGYLLGSLQHGGTHGRWGYDVGALRKRGDGYLDDSAFDLTNFAGKLVFRPVDRLELQLKASVHEQFAERSYLGATPGLFRQDRAFKAVHDDTLDLDWRDASLVVRRYWDRAELSVSLYKVEARRYWNRQDFARNRELAPPPGNTVATLGDPALDGGAIYLRASYGSRDRDFDYWGVEPRLLLELGGEGRARHRLWVGARAHFEDMIDARNDRATLDAPSRTRSRELRRVSARSFFVQDEIRIGERLSFIPGVRVEDYTQRRDISTSNYLPAAVNGETENTEVLPGLGVSFRASEKQEWFFGVHRGFAPPRTEAALTSDGTDLELEAERSWNWELGVRSRPIDGVTLEGTLFLLDFENQIVPANESGGASTANTNAGQTRHQGLELSGRADLLGLGGRTSESRLLLGAGLTLLDTENTTPGGLFEGKDLPYAPSRQLRVALDFEAARGTSVGVEGVYVSEQLADQANTRAESNDGTVGAVPAHALWNLRARHRLGKGAAELFVNVSNLLDRTYVASRAPMGIFPGAFRQVVGGVRWSF